MCWLAFMLVLVFKRFVFWPLDKIIKKIYAPLASPAKSNDYQRHHHERDHDKDDEDKQNNGRQDHD